VESMSAEEIDLAKIPERHLDLISSNELSHDYLKSLPKVTISNLSATNLSLNSSSLPAFVCRNCVHSPTTLTLSAEEFSIRGKGGKVRVVFVSPEAREALKKYLSFAKRYVRCPLCAGRAKELETKKDVRGLTRRSIERIVKQCAIKAGISKKVTPHVIRHCFATDLLSNGADIRSVQMMLGHANIATTQIYTHVTDAHLRDVHKKFHSKGK
jgi:site-specific recombinase XerC